MRERRVAVIGVAVALIAIGLAAAVWARPTPGRESGSDLIARGAGTTMLQGGTGPPDFTPVLTKLAFHAERSHSGVTGGFDCLATAPEAATGSGSAQFTVNVMYVVGTIDGATVDGDTATLTGHASITGLGAGSDVAFTFVVRRGGPGATAVLTVATLPTVAFHEVLLSGNFEVFGSD